MSRIGQGEPTIQSSYPPNGPAGGDLSGTYPNPSVIFGNDTLHVLKAGDTMTGKLSIVPSSDVIGLVITRPTGGTSDLIQIQNTALATRISFQLGNENDSRLVLNRNDDTAEVRLSLLSGGAVRGQWRLDNSNNMIFQRVTGAAGSEVFTNSFRVMNATGNVNVAGTLSFGATTEDILISKASTTRITCSQEFNGLTKIRIGDNGSASDTLDVNGTANFRNTADSLTVDIRAAVGQTANLLEITSSGGSQLAFIDVTGAFDSDQLVGGKSFQADGDSGGLLATNTITGVTDIPTTDPGWTTSNTVAMNAPDGYIKGYVGTQAVVIPYWNT